MNPGAVLNARSIPIDCRSFAAFSPLVRKHFCAGSFEGQVLVNGGVVKEGQPPGAAPAFRSKTAGTIVALDIKKGEVKTYTGHASDSCNGRLPPNRSGHASAVVSIAQQLLPDRSGMITSECVPGWLFVGGWKGRRLKATKNDVWFLSLNDMTWHQPTSVGEVPGPCNCATLDAIGHAHVVLFRGGDGELYHSDLFLYNLHTGVWNSVPNVNGNWPSPRSGHASAVYDDNYLFICGGWNGQVVLQDFWMWSFETRLWTELEFFDGWQPGPRTDASLTISGNVMLLYGGGHTAQTRFRNEPVLVCEIPNDPEADKFEWHPPPWRSGVEHVVSRCAHRSVLVAPGVVVVIGGLEPPNPDSDELRPARTTLILFFDKHLGFRCPRMAINSQAATMRSSQVVALNQLACTNTLADVKFDAQGVIIPAHRFPLCLISRVFRKMFTSGHNESRSSSGRIPVMHVQTGKDSLPGVFEVFLRYCYSLDLPGAILGVQHAPWPGYNSKEIYAHTVATILKFVKVHEEMREEDTSADLTHVVIPDVFFSTLFPADSLPFSPQLCTEVTRMLMGLLELADAYCVEYLQVLCELLLAFLVNAETAVEVAQTAVAFGAQSLVNFLSWIDRYPPDQRPTMSVPEEEIPAWLVHKRPNYREPHQPDDNLRFQIDDDNYNSTTRAPSDIENLTTAYNYDDTGTNSRAGRIPSESEIIRQQSVKLGIFSEDCRKDVVDRIRAGSAAASCHGICRPGKDNVDSIIFPNGPIPPMGPDEDGIEGTFASDIEEEIVAGLNRSDTSSGEEEDTGAAFPRPSSAERSFHSVLRRRSQSDCGHYHAPTPTGAPRSVTLLLPGNDEPTDPGKSPVCQNEGYKPPRSSRSMKALMFFRNNRSSSDRVELASSNSRESRHHLHLRRRPHFPRSDILNSAIVPQPHQPRPTESVMHHATVSPTVSNITFDHVFDIGAQPEQPLNVRQSRRSPPHPTTAGVADDASRHARHTARPYRNPPDYSPLPDPRGYVSTPVSRTSSPATSARSSLQRKGKALTAKLRRPRIA